LYPQDNKRRENLGKQGKNRGRGYFQRRKWTVEKITTMRHFEKIIHNRNKKRKTPGKRKFFPGLTFFSAKGYFPLTYYIGKTMFYDIFAGQRPINQHLNSCSIDNMIIPKSSKVAKTQVLQFQLTRMF